MSGEKYTRLFAPGNIAGMELANRFVVAPMARISADANGVPGTLMQNHYAEFAKGGFALVIAEGTYTDTLSSQSFPTQPGIATDAQVAGWRAVTDAVHANGAKILLQLMHVGALMFTNSFGAPAIAPSAVQPKGEKSARFGGDGEFGIPKEMTKTDIAVAIEGHASAAANAISAGFDGVELHGANGYLCDEFLTDYTNQRSDDYGGSLENRLRFQTETLQAIRGAVGPAPLVGVRISQSKSNDFIHQWAGGSEDARIIFSTLAKAGAQYIHVAGREGSDEVFGSGRTFAGLAHEHSGLPVIACGNLHEADIGERMLASGEADFIAVAKGAIADPALPNKVAAGETPRPFRPEMLMPLATVESTALWMAENAAG
jgi:2,4-dienoyl-CoA reductase-like NADH-dependent reductase (Old Yellow Enzyme family)